mmetsp:Transcript_51902/g.121682  ORF Transcript_51902/g.121682 Transcript_51902/m.121682 type:complete len:209 (-) Transcript_51902:166-792(-)
MTAQTKYASIGYTRNSLTVHSSLQTPSQVLNPGIEFQRSAHVTKHGLRWMNSEVNLSTEWKTNELRNVTIAQPRGPTLQVASEEWTLCLPEGEARLEQNNICWCYPKIVKKNEVGIVAEIQQKVVGQRELVQEVAQRDEGESLQGMPNVEFIWPGSNDIERQARVRHTKHECNLVLQLHTQRLIQLALHRIDNLPRFRCRVGKSFRHF